MKVDAFLTAAISAVVLFGVPMAYAVSPPALTISDNVGDSVTVDSTGTATCGGICSGSAIVSPGSIYWAGIVGAFSVNVELGESKPKLTPPQIQLAFLIQSGNTGGTLTTTWSDVGFDGLGPVTMQASDTLAGSVNATYTGYVDSTNALFGTGTTVGTFSHSGVGGSTTITGSGPGAEPYSMTGTVVAVMGAQSSLSLAGLNLLGTAPPPLALTCVAATTGQVGAPYSSALAASGGVPPYTYSIASGMLPNGLTLNPTTGAITGTPTQSGTFSFTAQVMDSNVNTALNTVQTTCMITISPPPALTLTCATSTGQVGQPYASKLTAGGGVPPYTFSIAAGSLPPGLTLDTVLGNITGVPTQAGTFNFTAEVQDSTGTMAGTLTANCSIVIAPPPVMLTCAANTGQVNVPYSSALSASGGVLPYMFSITSGSLPPGLTLNTTTGAITGTPTTAGTFNFTAKVMDSSGNSSTDTFTTSCSIVISPSPLTLTCATSTGQVGVAYNSALVAGGGQPPFTYSVTSGSLPPGLTLNPSTGAITGTPTTAGTFNFTAQVVDSRNDVAGTMTSNCSIVISPSPLTLTCATSTGQVGVAYNSALVAGGGLPPFTYSVTSGSLPPGLTLNPSTGAITGTPTTAGTFNFTAQVVDSRNNAAGTMTSNCSIVISPSLLTLTCATSTGQVGVAYNSALVAGGGQPPFTYSVTSGSLPPGLTLNPSTGAITGTPTTAGTFNFTAKVVDSRNNAAGTMTSNCSIVISPSALTLTCATSTGQVGVVYNSGLVAGGGLPPFTYSVTSGSLPPGLTLNPSTGAITGTPTTAGTFNFTAKVVDSRNNAAGTMTSNCSIVISPSPLTLACPPAITGKVGSSYSSGFVASGGVPPYAFSIATGSLPPGLTLNASTGAITGKPTTAGTFSFTGKVIDSKGNVALSACSGSCTGVTTTTWNFNLPSGTLGTSQAYTVNGVTITAYGFTSSGKAVNLYGKNAGGDENGLGISGTTDSEIDTSHFVQLDLTNLINGGATNPTILINSVQTGETYAIYGSNALGQLGTLLYSGTSSSDDKAFAIPGYPSYKYIAVIATCQNVLIGAVSATTTSGTCTITISPSSGPPLTASCGACSGSTGNGTVGNSYSGSVTASGGTGSYTFSLVSGSSLPRGLTLNASTGKITGTPTTAGTYNFTFQVQDSAGNKSTAACTIVISKPYQTCSQYGWGSQPNGNNGGAWLQQKYSKVYSGGWVSVGSTNTLKFNSSSAVGGYMWNNGPIQTLSTSATNPTNNSVPNQLAADVLALQLNVDFSNAGVTLQGLGNLTLQSGYLAGWNVQQVLALANFALVGQNWIPTLLLTDLDDIVESINNAFNTDNGTTLNTAYLQ